MGVFEDAEHEFEVGFGIGCPLPSLWIQGAGIQTYKTSYFGEIWYMGFFEGNKMIFLISRILKMNKSNFQKSYWSSPLIFDEYFILS